MYKFKNKEERKFWKECIRHAERMDNSTIEAVHHIHNYTEYADKMLDELNIRYSAKNPMVLPEEVVTIIDALNKACHLAAVRLESGNAEEREFNKNIALEVRKAIKMCEDKITIKNAR